MKKLIAFGFVLALSFGLKAQEASLLWELQSPQGKTSYLFGTYHLMGSDFLQEKPRILKAYQASDRVIVETVIDSALLGEMAVFSLMPQSSLRSLYDSAEYALVKSKMEPVLNMPLGAVDKLKPMALAMAYSTKMAQEATPQAMVYGGAPLDAFFAIDAKRRGITVVQLETMMEQAEMLLNHETVEEQAEDLIELLAEDEKAFEDSKRLVEAYVAEDIKEMMLLSDEYEASAGDLDYLINERNRKWLPKLKEAFAENTCFVAVGALHLGGEEGLINLLREQGFKVQALK